MKKISDWALASEFTENIFTLSFLFRAIMLQEYASITIGDGPKYSSRPYSYWMKSFKVKRGVAEDAIKALKASGAIETAIKKNKAGTPTLHIRISQKIIDRKRCETDNAEALKGTIENVCEAQTKTPVGHEPYNIGIYMEKENGNKQSFGLLTPGNPASKTVDDFDVTGEGLDTVPPSFTNLQKLWATRWKKFQSGPVDGLPGSPKVRAQWKQFVTKCENWNDHPLQLISLTLENWGEFRSVLKNKTGQGSSAHPNIGVIFGQFPTLHEMNASVEIEDFKYDEGESPNDKLMADFYENQNGGD